MPSVAIPARPLTAQRARTEGYGGRPTLDEVLGSAWHELRLGAHATCVVCGGRMDPEPDGGRCRNCGSALS